MEQTIIGIIALGIAMFVRRKDALPPRWQPTRHTWVAVGTGLLAFLLSTSLLLFDAQSIPARVILYVGIYILCGVTIPWGYTLLVERGTKESMGITRERWAPSLILNVVMAGLFSLIIVFEADLAAMDWIQFGKAAVVLAGAGGLFELFLYCGFIHLRLEKAFGTLPAILLTSAIYVLWHTGTQLPLEPDPLLAVVKLFGVGLLYQSVFSITRNLLVIWPFFNAVGVMIDFAVNIGEVELVSASFNWAILSLVLMALTGAILTWAGRRRRTTTQPTSFG